MNRAAGPIDIARETHPGRRSWLDTLVTIPAAVLPLLPSFSCPVCIAAYAGLLSSLGLGIVLKDSVQRPAIVFFLTVTVGTVAWTSRQHRIVWPLLAVLTGSLAVIAGRLVWSIPPVVYVGVAALVVGAVWNLALKRRGPRVAIGLPSKRSMHA